MKLNSANNYAVFLQLAFYLKHAVNLLELIKTYYSKFEKFRDFTFLTGIGQ